MIKSLYTHTLDTITATDSLKQRLLKLSSPTFDKKRQPKTEAARKTSRWLVPVSSCLVLALVAGISYPLVRGSTIDLPHSRGNVRASYTLFAPHVKTHYDLVYLTEYEIINDWTTDIFYGTVEEIRNISISFNGDVSYQAIAKIKVNEVLHGDVAYGDVISVLLPCPIGQWLWIEDTGVISQLRAGMSGIFMPRKYMEDDTWEQNGAILVLSDITDYGLGDGERFAFLETSQGLVFADFAYPSLPKDAGLDDVRAFIEAQLD